MHAAAPYLSDFENFDALGTDSFHDVINKVWPDDGIVPWQSAEEYRRIVEFLDSVPPHIQSDVGRWFLRKREELASGRHRATGLVRLNRQDRLVYGCSDRAYWDQAKSWVAHFCALTWWRHLQALESGARDNSITLGVGALVEECHGEQGVSYSFVRLAGSQSIQVMPADLRSTLEWRYGVHNHEMGTTKAVGVGRNEPCPCLSGKKYKRCHGQ